MEENKNFLDALDTLIKNAGDLLVIRIDDKRNCNDYDDKKQVFLYGSQVFWHILITDTLEINAQNLIDAESLINKARQNKNYEENYKKNHPDLLTAIKFRLQKNNQYCN